MHSLPHEVILDLTVHAVAILHRQTERLRIAAAVPWNIATSRMVHLGKSIVGGREFTVYLTVRDGSDLW